MKSRLPRILLSLAVGLAALDVGLSLTVVRDGILLGRPLPPFGALNHPAQREALERMESSSGNPLGLFAFDAELGWTPIPGRASEEGQVHFDARGLRAAREHADAAPAGTLRVACCGDSFTFGDEVADADCYPALLESGFAGVEALNFGVGAYGTDQSLLRFRREGRGAGAGAVVIGLFLENIGRNVNRYRPLWNTRTGMIVPKPRFVLEGERLVLVPQPFASEAEFLASFRDGSVMARLSEHEYWLGRPTLPTGRASSLLRLAAAFLAYDQRRPERLWADVDGEPFRVTLALLQEFAREARAAGAARAAVLIFPSKRELAQAASSGEVHWGELLRALEQAGIECVDPTRALVEREAALASEGGGRSVYLEGHLSGEGNRVVAAAVAGWLGLRPANP